MARIRTIKPEFFTSLTIANLPLAARLTFIGLWTHVDDGGRCVDEVRLIRAALWPLDDRLASDVEEDLKVLQDASLIVRYEHAGRRYLAVRNWREHQRIDKPKPSKLPPPDNGIPGPTGPPGDTVDDPSASTDAQFPDPSGTDPGRIPDESESRPGSVPGGKEQGTGKGTGIEGGASAREEMPWMGADRAATTEHMFAAWWKAFGTRTAQGRGSIQDAIAEALRNGLAADELWSALVRLGDTSKPVTGACIQIALADVRKRASPPPPAAAAASNVIALAAPRTATSDQRAQQALDAGRRLQALADARTQEPM